MLNKIQARELAARIYREIPGIATTIQKDDFLTLEESYHIDVHKPNIIRLCIRSESQWEERKGLLDKYESHSE